MNTIINAPKMPKTFLPTLDVIIMIGAAVVLILIGLRINRIASKFQGREDPFNWSPFVKQEEKDKIWKYTAFIFLTIIVAIVLVIGCGIIFG